MSLISRTAVSILLAAGLACAGNWSADAFPSTAASYFQAGSDPVNLLPDFIPDWHLKRPEFRQFCFGLCTTSEIQP